MYSGDVNNAGSSSPCGAQNESSIVNKAEPTIVTQASGPVTIGSAIHDTATLSGGVTPTGTIAFHVTATPRARLRSRRKAGCQRP